MKAVYICTLLVFNIAMISAQTPLIDRDVFFGNPSIASGQLSPDGKYVSFMKEYEGIMNLWVKTFDEPFEDARLMTASASPILGYAWTRDGKYLIYVNDKGGDENLNVFAVDPTATGKPAPDSRNLTPMDEVRAQFYQISKKNPDKAMIGLNDRDKAWHDLYELTISTGELKKVFENDNRYTGYHFDWDENLRGASRTDEDGNSQILSLDADGNFKEIYTTNLSESAYIAGWTPDNSMMYLVSNKGDVNLSTLYTVDPSTGKTTKVESDPKNKVDFGGLWIHDETREIISTSYTYDKRERNFKNKEFEMIYNHLKSQFPGREVGFSSFTKDYKKMLVSVSGDIYATEIYFYDTESQDLILQYTPRPELKKIEEHLSPMEPVAYASSDGKMISGYLTIPRGKTNKNLPTVIMVHGGPKGPRDYWGYDASVQFLANRGYAVLQPNFRASGGFGKEFLNAGDKQWGKLMQDDITWGAKYLINEGISDPSNIAIMGGSYGGYATLAGLAFTPDVYACGIDIVGPSNLFTLLESIPPYWEAGRKWLYEMVGDPDTEEGKKLLTEASPLFSVDQIEKPLLIVQGANDPRVKKAESDQIVIALRDKNHPVKYLLADDEGHGFRKPLNRMAMYAEAERFLAEHIGGRHQESMPEDVKETLDQITVDIASVTYDPPTTGAALTAMPEVAYNWAEGSTEYIVNLAMGDNTIPMTMTRKITQNGDNWTITDASAGPMGNASDAATYSPGFIPLSRAISQGGMNVNMEYDGSDLSLNAMGRDMKVSADGAMMIDGPGVDLYLAHAEMSPGDEMICYTVDMMTMQPKKVIVSRAEDETLDGKNQMVFHLINAENEKDKTTLWIDDSKTAYKMEQAIPAMNATMTMTKK